jgi:hypothetical protein
MNYATFGGGEVHDTPLDSGDETVNWLWRTRANWGERLLAVWLIATGLLPLVGKSVPHSGEALSVLAIAAGILMLLRR